MFRQRAGVLAILMLGLPLAGKAGVIYGINQTGIGFDQGSITGTIQTDGTIGAITAGNIVAWNLQAQCSFMSCSGSNFTLNNGNSSISISGTDELSATATQLFYNYGVSGSFIGSFEIVDGSNAWALGLTSSTLTYEEILPTGLGGNAEPESGTQVIGTAETAPEPPSDIFLGLGLITIAACGSRLRAMKRSRAGKDSPRN